MAGLPRSRLRTTRSRARSSRISPSGWASDPRRFRFKGDLADVRIYRRTLPVEEVREIVSSPFLAIARMPAGSRTKAQQEQLSRYYKEHIDQELRAASERLKQQVAEKTAFEAAIPTVMVMEDLPTPRPTYVLKRGRYDMPDTSQKVDPGVPACLSPLPAGAPANRLGLARWLASPENPLTARVAVNRLWQQHFGTGLVKTAENFGIQSEPPSHPALLDWLATELIRSGWDLKAMHRLIVTSATYRQSSSVPASLVQRDPENRLLARGPRFRLPAELVRDNALAIAGLLTTKSRRAVRASPISRRVSGKSWPEGQGRGRTSRTRARTSIAAASTSTASGPCPIPPWSTSTPPAGRSARSSGPAPTRRSRRSSCSTM